MEFRASKGKGAKRAKKKKEDKEIKIKMKIGNITYTVGGNYKKTWPTLEEKLIGLMEKDT